MTGNTSECIARDGISLLNVDQATCRKDNQRFANLLALAELSSPTIDLLSYLECHVVDSGPGRAVQIAIDDPFKAIAPVSVPVIKDLIALSRRYPCGNDIERFISALGEKIVQAMSDGSLKFSDGKQVLWPEQPRQSKEWKKACEVLAELFSHGSDASIDRTLSAINAQVLRNIPSEAFKAIVTAMAQSDRAFAEPFAPRVAGLLNPFLEEALAQRDYSYPNWWTLATVFTRGGPAARAYASPFLAKAIVQWGDSQLALHFVLTAIHDENDAGGSYAGLRREAARETIRLICIELADRCIAALDRISDEHAFITPFQRLLYLTTYRTWDEDFFIVDRCHELGCQTAAGSELARVLKTGREQILEAAPSQNLLVFYAQNRTQGIYNYGSAEFVKVLVSTLGEAQTRALFEA